MPIEVTPLPEPIPEPIAPARKKIYAYCLWCNGLGKLPTGGITECPYCGGDGQILFGEIEA